MNQLNKILLPTHNATGHPLRKIAPLALVAMVVGVALFIAYGLAGTAHVQAESGAIPSLTLDSNEPGQLVINWQAPDPAPTDYRLSWANTSLEFLSYKDSNEAQRGNVYPAGGVITLTLTNLTPGDTYKVQMRSRYYNEDGSGRQSSGPWTATATQRVKNHPPAAPTSLTISEVAHDSLILSWDDPQDANITGYRIQRGTDADSLHSIEANTESASTNYTDSTVEPETTYHYAVIALSQDGNGARSITSVTTPAEPKETVQNDPPPAPTGLTAARVGHSVLALTWDDPQDANITGYRVLRGAEADNLSVINSDTGSNATEYEDDTVAPETTYHYAVMALSADGDGAQSTALSATTTEAPDSKDPPPQGVGARQSITTTEVPANWSLKPTSLNAGDKFRLLFLSSTKRNATVTAIATYNTFIQNRAAAGHSDIRAYSAGFRVVGCTAAVDARDNTSTTYISTDKGVPIYWLNGTKVADQYEDFYDESWDDEVNDKNESGTDGPDTSQSANRPFTGCAHNGTEAGGTSRALGTSSVITGQPNSSDSGQGPLGSAIRSPSSQSRPMYGLSAVFQVATASTDATLSALTVSPKDISGFAADRTSYEVGVASTVTQATITATKGHSAATVAYSTTDAETSAGHQVNLSAGRNEVTITVTAEDTTTTGTYTVSINRGVTDAFGWKASDDFDGLITAENNLSRGMWSDGTTLWVTDLHDAKIYAYNLATKARDASKDFDTLDAAGNDSPYGTWSDGTTMWVTDFPDGKVYAYDMTTKARDVSKDFDTPDRPTGIWSNGTTMWVAVQLPARIYAYDMTTKARDAGKDFDTLSAAGNTHPRGIWSNNITMWVTEEDGKLYAYNMASKARDADKDFNTLSAAGNGHPSGIWANTNTMWVSDSGDGKIYSYNMPVIAPNTPAAGMPAVTAPNVFRVPAVLGVDLSGITDADGTTGIASNATYKWQRFAANGTTLDTDSIGTASTYTLTDADAGKTLKVVVSYTDDASNSEGPLTSAATRAITAAASCAAPTLTGGAVFLGPARKVEVGEFNLGAHAYWGFNKAEDAGSLDNAKFTTGDPNNYEILLAATRSRDDWLLVLDAAFPANVQRTLAVHFCDEDIGLGSVTPVPSSGNYYYTSDTLLQKWSPHAERTIYVSQDAVAPTFASATVSGTTLVITLSEDLGAAGSLANSAFTVKKGPSGSQTTLTLSSTAPVISGSTVTLTLATASSVTASDTNVLVTYTKPTTGTANKLVDAFGNVLVTFAADQVVTNLLSGTNAPPTVENMIPDQSASADTAFSYTFPDTTFADADLDTLTYSATKADGTALPMWLTFTAGTRTFSGTPTAAETVLVKVTASDGNGGSVSDTFDITVRTAANTAPTAANATVDTDQDTSYTFTAADFNYSDPDNNPLASVKITTIPAAGKGTLALDGTNIVSAVLPKTVTATELTGGGLKYNPPANENGTAYTSFEFKVNDGTVDSAGEYTITINVNPIHTAPLVHPANTLVSNINHASSGTYTVRPHGDLAIQLPPPAPQESRYEDGWNLNTIKIRVSGVDAGEQIYGRLHPGKSVQNNPGSSGPATGVGSSSGNPFRSVSVSPDGIATFSNPDPSGFNPKSQYFYFIVSVNSGEIEVGKTATADLDAGTPNDLNLGPTWHRADNSWSADSTATDRIQILITGSVKPVDVISPEPPPVPSRPSAPNDGVSTYRLGSWRSVNLTGADEFGDAIYKVRLQKDTNYRVEFRTANSYASATAIDAGMLVTNNLVDLEAVTSGTGSPFIVEVGEDGNPSTTLAKATSWFRYNTSSLEQGIWSNMLYQDFRTPDILAAGGNADCDAESEAQLVQETDCVYQFDYPTDYYLNIGTGIGVPTGEYGTMQFRISRTTDQTLGGMSRMSEDSEASFSIPARIEDPVSENGSAVDNKLSADGEIHFAGDVDWYIPEHSATACSFSVAGRDLDGDIGTNDSASGLRMRAYDRNFGERAAPSNRGSFRSSLSGVLPSDGEKLLEVTGTRAGGYRIIVTCEDLPAEGPTTDRLGNLIPHIQMGNSKRYFDDHRPYHENLSEEVEPVDKYGHEVIDLTARTSGSVTATISYPGDGDDFRLTVTPGRRYSITLSSVAATLSTPGHPDGNTVRLQRLDLSSRTQPYAVSCKSLS